MSLLSSLLNGTLEQDIVKAVDTLERVAGVVVEKLEQAPETIEERAESVAKEATRATRIIDVVEQRVQGSTTSSNEVS